MNLSTAEYNEIEHTVQQAMQAWNIPGLALAIVKDDQVLLAKGFGTRETGKTEPVDEHTLFAIGSNTKAFTATAIGLLVQEGKLAWDDPVTKYLPSFRLQDVHASQLFTIRDLLCHRSGLGTWAGDVLLMGDYSPEEIAPRLRHIPPEFSFRAGYGYSNLMFVTAGLVISTVSGLSWEDFIRQRLFEPLGMRDSLPHPRYLKPGANVATPHEDIDGRLQAVTHRSDERAGAAGAIYASAADISQWLRLQLNQGRLDGKQLVDPAIITEMQTAHTLIPMKEVDRKLFPTRNFSAYGLGWFISDDGGRFIVRHTGGVAGMLSSTLLLPQEKLGVAIYTNKLPNSAYVALSYYLGEKLTGAVPQDWIQRYLAQNREDQQKLQQAKQQISAARAKDTRPSLALDKYAGEYESDILGGASIRLAGEQLYFQLHSAATISGPLEHWHYDTFRCHWNDPTLGDSLIPFRSDGQGNVVELRVKIREDWIDPLEHVFKKKS